MSCNRVNRVTLPFPLVTRDSWGFVVGVMFVRCDDINEGPHYKSIAAVYSPNTYMWTSYIYTVSCSQAAFLLAEWFHMIYSPFAFLINIDILIVGSYLRTQDTVIVFLETFFSSNYKLCKTSKMTLRKSLRLQVDCSRIQNEKNKGLATGVAEKYGCTLPLYCTVSDQQHGLCDG